MNVKRIAIATTIGLLCGAIWSAIVRFAIAIPAFEQGTSALIMVPFGVVYGIIEDCMATKFS